SILPAQAASTEGSARAAVKTLEEQKAPSVTAKAIERTSVFGAAPTANTAVRGLPALPAPPPQLSAALPRTADVASCPGNPNALGISRVVEIDTTGGPGFGFEHFKSHDFLREGEVVLTFDDG